jgi:Zinc finger, C2H2 type
MIVHKGRDEPAFKCRDCNLNFITKDELRLHSYDHYAGTLHFCPQPNCDRFFKTASYLRSHAKIHAPAMYKCDVRIKNFENIYVNLSSFFILEMREKILPKRKSHETQKDLQGKSNRSIEDRYEGRRGDCKSTVEVAWWKVVKNL